MQDKQSNIALNYQRKAEKCFVSGGPRLGSRSVVRRKFTYKETTLVIGVLVAIVIAVATFWSFKKRPALFNTFAGSTASVRNLSIEHIFEYTLREK